MGPLIIGYWNIRGLAGALRMMCLYAGQPFENKVYRLTERLERGEWLVDHKPQLKEKHALINLPYIIDGEIIVAQSNACLSYLGRKFDMWGTTPREVISCEELLCEIMDVRNNFTAFTYGRAGDPTDKEKVREFLAGAKAGVFSKLETHLSREPHFTLQTPFLIGGHATAPDFHCFEMLDQHVFLAKYYDIILLDDTLPLLSTYYNGWLQLPKNQKYLNSVLRAAPLNNMNAKFGGTCSGARWTPDQELPERIDGMY